jgi:hypothetical protein
MPSRSLLGAIRKAAKPDEDDPPIVGEDSA